MITLQNNRLVFEFPEVHKKAVCSITFQQTLRIPDDDREYPLPPGLGNFPLKHLEDYSDRLPESSLKRGGVILPMYQSQAMWINFGSHYSFFNRDRYPFAIKIGTGKVNAVSGKPWTNELTPFHSGKRGYGRRTVSWDSDERQDYVVIPEQPWLDGYCVGKGVIRQFVAMPLGEGYTVEEQITGEAEYGGIQIIAYPMKAEVYERLFKHKVEDVEVSIQCSMSVFPPSMGLAPGGKMRQEIYEDPYRFDDWDTSHFSRCFVTIANSTMWKELTGEYPPMAPPTSTDYTKAGLPWFDYYDDELQALDGSKLLTSLKSVKEMGKQKGENPLPENTSTDTGCVVVHVGKKKRTNVVLEGTF